MADGSWRIPTSFFILGFLALATLGQDSLTITDDFSRYAEGAEPGDPWIADGFGWRVHSGVLRAVCPVDSMLRLRRPRWFRTLRIEARLTVLRGLRTRWKVVGLAAVHDDEHFWHAALVEAPDNAGKRHYLELAMRLPGVWPASDGVSVVKEMNLGVDWQYNHPYRLLLELGNARARAVLMELDGTVLAEKVVALSPPAVMDGSPALRCNGFEAHFDEVRIVASDVAGEPRVRALRPPPLNVPTIRQIKGRDTGFFHVEKKNGVWWVIAPGGEGFYAIGTDHVRYAGHWCEKLGYAPYGKVTKRLYGTEDRWAEVATDRLKRWNFNLLGAGHSRSCRYRGLAHTEFLSLGSAFAGYDPLVAKVHWTGFPNVFSPDWEKWCDKQAWRMCRPNRDDPWLFGYFIDNELEWWGKGGGEVGLAIEAAKLPPDNPAKQALIRLLRDKYRTIAALNRAWGATYASWDDLANQSRVNAANTDALRRDALAFVAEAADRYFRIACQAIRRWDPNHMILGCRFAGDAPPGVWEAAGRYCDIVTFNFYGRVDLLRAAAPGTAERWTAYYEKARRPLMITEWSFPALDSGLPCKHGAGMRVDTQQQKALCYEVYQRMIFSLPFMVGSDYFMWVDEPALGISSTFPEDSNYGLVNEQDEPYRTLTDTARRINAMAYQLHSGDGPELAVEAIDYRAGRLRARVSNTGTRPARYELVFLANGEQVERLAVRSPAGETRWFEVPLALRGPIFATVIADPTRHLPERDTTNNLARRLIYKPCPWPQPPEGRWLARLPVVVEAGPPALPEGYPVAVPADALKRFGQAQQVARRITARDAAGHTVACQLEPWDDGWQVALALPMRVPPYGGTVLYIYVADADLPQPKPAITFSRSATRWTADNGILKLEGLEQGNIVDRILYRSHPMGRLNPLVWIRRHGQNLWVQTTRTVKLQSFSGPVRAAVQVWCENEPPQPAITAVDKQGNMAPQHAQPTRFRVAHRLWIAPHQPWFADQFISLTNSDDVDLEVHGWFYYLLSAIGGDPADDELGGPRVPNRWLRLGAWQDKALGLMLGAIPAPDDRIAGYFWKDEGGGQHPDIRRLFQPPATLKPGETLTESPSAPAVLVFAGPAEQRPWMTVASVALALPDATVKPLGLEKP